VNLMESFRAALRALRANTFRSILTMLGVIIGVSSVILLVGIGTGVRDDMTSQIEDMGSNLLFVFPGKMDDMGSAPAKRLQMEDYDYLKARLPEAEAVVAIFEAPTMVKAGNKSIRASMSSSSDGDHVAFKTDIARGRGLRRTDMDSSARVVVLGWKAAAELFPNSTSIGKTVSVNGQKLKVVGVAAEKGGSMGSQPDLAVYMPVTTALRVMGASDLSLIAVKVPETRLLEPTSKHITRLLKPRFGEDLSVYSQKETAGVMDKFMNTLTVMLAGIAGISLLVGGIGIMNIMLVSVTERTREIGIRKAIGARTWEVLTQFIIEAVVLAVLGGLIGVLLAVGAAAALKPVIPTSIEFGSAATAFLFSAGIGVFFGVYPASKAARLDPIVALRHE
jgi:putative ABC transport system permease protein